MELYIDIRKLSVGGWWVHLDYNISSGPFLCFEIDIGNEAGPEIENFFWTIFVDLE